MPMRKKPIARKSIAGLSTEDKFRRLRGLRLTASNIDNYRKVFAEALHLGLERETANAIANSIAGTNYPLYH